MAEESNWERDFQKGEKGEKEFYGYLKRRYPNKNIKWLQKAHEADFMIDDDKVELKTDFTKHTNFFIEYFSNIDTRRMGGPYQASEYNARHFIYWFVDKRNPYQWCCFRFLLKELIDWLNINKNCYQTRRKLNKGFVTLGHIIPIETLSKQSFCKIIRIEVK
jgi:hypothetical protein